MKKIITILVCVGILLASSACNFFGGGDDEQPMTTAEREVYITVDEVEVLALRGEVYGAQFPLGTDLDTVREYFSQRVLDTLGDDAEENDAEEDGEPADPNNITIVGDGVTYEFTRGNNLTRVMYSGQEYFFVNNNIEAGAAIIFMSSSAYNFEVGNAFSVDIIHSLGEPHAQDVPPHSQLFFLLGASPNVMRFTYIFGDMRLDFIFDDDQLSAAVLTDTRLFDGFYTVVAPPPDIVYTDPPTPPGDDVPTVQYQTTPMPQGETP